MDGGCCFFFPFGKCERCDVRMSHECVFPTLETSTAVIDSLYFKCQELIEEIGCVMCVCW